MGRRIGANSTNIPPQGNTYILTEDLSILVPLTGEKLGIPEATLKIDLNESFFKELFEELGQMIRTHCLAGEEVELVALPYDSFTDLLYKHDRTDKDKSTEYWICLDTVYAKFDREEEVYRLSISRYVDDDWNYIDERGPRPEDGEMSISERIVQCVSKFRKNLKLGKELYPVIIDDGTFDGKTVIAVLSELAKNNIYVDSVRLGVSKLEGLFRICAWNIADEDQRVHRVRFLGVSKICPSLRAWIHERDLFPGILYAGKAIGENKDGLISAKRVGERRQPIRTQYLRGWGNMERWTLLPKGHDRFTYEVLGLSLKLWQRIQALRRKPILVEELPAIPWKLYNPDLRKLDKTLKMPWLDVLEDEYKATRKGRWPSNIWGLLK